MSGVVNFLRGIVGSVFASVAKGIAENMPKPLITQENNPELIQAVLAQMQNNDTQIMSAKILDLEKAVYQLAGRQKESLERQHQQEEILVAISTTLEEMLHGMGMAEQDDDVDDEEALADAWENKKNASTLN